MQNICYHFKRGTNNYTIATIFDNRLCYMFLYAYIEHKPQIPYNKITALFPHAMVAI